MRPLVSCSSAAFAHANCTLQRYASMQSGLHFKLSGCFHTLLSLAQHTTPLSSCHLSSRMLLAGTQSMSELLARTGHARPEKHSRWSTPSGQNQKFDGSELMQSKAHNEHFCQSPALPSRNSLTQHGVTSGLLWIWSLRCLAHFATLAIPVKLAALNGMFLGSDTQCAHVRPPPISSRCT